MKRVSADALCFRGSLFGRYRNASRSGVGSFVPLRTVCPVDVQNVKRKGGEEEDINPAKIMKDRRYKWPPRDIAVALQANLQFIKNMSPDKITNTLHQLGITENTSLDSYFCDIAQNFFKNNLKYTSRSDSYLSFIKEDHTFEEFFLIYVILKFGFDSTQKKLETSSEVFGEIDFDIVSEKLQLIGINSTPVSANIKYFKMAREDESVSIDNLRWRAEITPGSHVTIDLVELAEERNENKAFY